MGLRLNYLVWSLNRNLFNFILKNLLKETSDFKNQEIFYWNSRVKKAERNLKHKIETFYKNIANEVDDNFDYEGIFDKKNDVQKTNNPADRSRLDVSYLMGTLNRSRAFEDNIFNNTLHKNEHSISKNSENTLIIHNSRRLSDKMINAKFQSRNSFKFLPKGKIHNFKRDSTKSKSLAHIFALNNKFSDSGSNKRRGSTKSGNSNNIMNYIIHGNNNEDNGHFRKKFEDAKSSQSRIQLYDPRSDVKSMNTLGIPMASNSAFPNTPVYQASSFNRPRKISVDYKMPVLDKSSLSSPHFDEQMQNIRNEMNISRNGANSVFDPVYLNGSTRDHPQTDILTKSSKTDEIEYE